MDGVPLIRVAAAIIRNGDRFLLTQRMSGSHFAGWWEFPGGKIEAGETVELALARECREELGIEIRVGPQFRRVSHHYTDRRVDLQFHEASVVAGEPAALEVAGLGWFSPAEMSGLQILPADAPVVDALATLVTGGAAVTWTFPEGFSWSASRANVFDSCPRSYFYQYYLATDRAADATREDVQRAARLKRLTSVPLWIGSHVHDTIQGLLNRARAGAMIDVEMALDAMVRQMRADYAASLVGRFVTREGQWTSQARFHEHEYGRDVATEEWRRRVDEARQMVRACAALGYPEVVRHAGPAHVRALEELEDWPLDGVRIFLRIDLAFEDADGLVHIVDWKTGQREHGDTPLQMLGYAMFAIRRWGVAPECLRVKEVFLAKPDPDRPCTVTAETLAAAERSMRTSIEKMLARLDDPHRDVGRQARFEAAPHPARCTLCNYVGMCPEGQQALAAARRVEPTVESS